MATLPELIARIHKESPDALGNLNERVVVRLLRAAFGTVARDLDHSADGAYNVSGLGTFRVRTVPADAEGKGGGRRILFKPAPARTPVKK